MCATTSAGAEARRVYASDSVRMGFRMRHRVRSAERIFWTIHGGPQLSSAQGMDLETPWPVGRG